MAPKKASRPPREGIRLGKDRETSLERRRAYRNSALTVLVVSNGTRTERQYFDALRRGSWGKPFHLTIKNHAPEALIDFATSEKSNAAYDHVWCVFDVDEFEVAEVLRRAGKEGIGIAVSQPCFEVWLILHKKDHRRSF